MEGEIRVDDHEVCHLSLQQTFSRLLSVFNARGGGFGVVANITYYVLLV